MLTVPLLDRLSQARNVLIAGCGGGFDIYSGVPFIDGLLKAGKSVVLANLSFTDTKRCGGEPITPVTWRLDRRSRSLAYFPELWLMEWLGRRGIEVPVYVFSRTGACPLSAGYQAIISAHDIDAVLLIDGGTDSVIFGDEPGLGTVEEDTASIVAAHNATNGEALLTAIGFGIDHFHGVSHYAFLENVAQLARQGGYLGTVSLTPGTPESEAFLDLVDYANQRQPVHRSIVCNSIATALRGEFGNFHATGRTRGSELFINPLMVQYWSFTTGSLIANMASITELLATQTIDEVRQVVERHREGLPVRPRKVVPL